MGLRIGTPTESLTTVRNLRTIGVQQLQTFERLSTGLRINRASDDPSGLVLLTQFRGQLNSISEAVSNVQSASNLVQTAEGGLGQISDQLSRLKALIVEASNTGVVGDDARQAIQDSLNAGLQGINRSAQTTRYGDLNLLNGNLDFSVDAVSPELEQVQVQSGFFPAGFPQPVPVNVLSTATRAQANGTIAPVQSAASTIRISGNIGNQDINIPAGATQAEVETAINAVTDVTGVEAVGGVIRSTEFGRDASVHFEEVSGDLEGVAPGLTQGTDVVATVNGQTASGRGNNISLTSQNLTATIRVEPETTGAFSFRIIGGGASFDLGTTRQDQFVMGIAASDVFHLGQTGGLGNLSTIQVGGANSFLDNPQNALSIVDAAISEVSTLRGRLGSVQSRVFESTGRSLAVSYEKLTESSSLLGDADMAEEIARSVRQQLIKESGLRVLKQTNLNAGMALRLLA